MNKELDSLTAFDNADDRVSLHSTVRTNKKGVPYIGRCILCGKEELTGKAITGKCDNPPGLTQGESLLLILDGSDD